MDEIKETVIYSENDNTDSLLEMYDDKRRIGLDDVISTQAVICVLAAAILFVLNLRYPDEAEKLFEQLRHCMNDTSFVLANPVDSIISYMQSR